jgi:choline dehydrogenase-like flavoprotein
MMIDARQIADGDVIATEVCVIGAGPAGILLARELAGQDFRVCLLEAGGLQPEPDIQLLAASADEARGDGYPNFQHLYQRQFGGNSNIWGIQYGKDRNGVRYIPLDATDFEKHDWIPHSGWAFSRSHLDPYYERAHVACQTGPYDYNVATWEGENTHQIPFEGDRVKTQMFQFGPADIFKDEYRQQLEHSPNIQTLTYGTAVELETDQLAQTVTQVRVATLAGNQFHIAAKLVVLAMGTVENVRLLLTSDHHQQGGLGNQYDTVGRYFMDHPLIRSGLLTPQNSSVFQTLGLYDAHWVKGAMVIGKPVLTEQCRQEQQLLGINTAIFPRSALFRMNLLRLLFPNGKAYRSEAVEAAKGLLHPLKKRQLPDHALTQITTCLKGIDDILYYQWRRQYMWGKQSALSFSKYGFDVSGWVNESNLESTFNCFEVMHVTEQAPDPDNRIVLGQARDRLGARKPQLYWRWNDIDIHSVQRSQQIFAEELAKAGIGTIKFEGDKGLPHLSLASLHHHMGGTRMNEDPRQGVVDANCKVHGVSNLFIVGSSVFPTGGYANPTLTIAALAIRLADRIKIEMQLTPTGKRLLHHPRIK